MKKALLGIILMSGSVYAMDKTKVIKFAVKQTVVELKVEKNQCTYTKKTKPVQVPQKEEQEEFSQLVEFTPPFFCGGVYDDGVTINLRSSGH